MATIYVPIPISDSTVSSGTNPGKTGLTPTVLAGYLLSNPATVIASGNYPVITAAGVGNTGASGVYVAAYDPEANGEAIFEIDAGAGLTANADRFFYLIFTRDSSRILGAVNSANKVVEVVLTDTLTTYTGNTPQTGDNFPKVTSINSTINNSQINGIITASSQLSLTIGTLTVAGSAFTPPAGDLAGMQCIVQDASTGAIKARLTILGDGGTTTRTLTFTSPGFASAPNVNDTVSIA